MVIIHLHEVVFFAHHGIYKEETEKGNQFEVNLDVFYKDHGKRFRSVDQTINYEDLHTIVRNEMQIATPLLEHVCQEIITKIKKQYISVKEIRITIYKLKPPIKEFNGRVGVTIIKKYK